VTLVGVHAARRRQVGLGLIAFGLAGILLIVLAAALVIGSLGAAAGLASSLEQQRSDLVDLLEPAAAALGQSATTAGNASASLTATAAAAGDAADLTEQLATSMDALSQAASVQVFGTRPFGAAASSLGDVAARSRQLSVDLRTTQTSISGNVTDSAAVAAELRTLASQLEELRKRATETEGSAFVGQGMLDLTRVILLGLLAWLAVPAVAALWLGSRLRRPLPEAPQVARIEA
jgi:hypothetical protein